MLPKPKPDNLRLRPVSVYRKMAIVKMRTLNCIDHFKRTIDKRFFYPIPGSKIVLCIDRDFEKRVDALYIFSWFVFATFLLSDSLDPRPLPSLHMSRRYSALSITWH